MSHSAIEQGKGRDVCSGLGGPACCERLHCTEAVGFLARDRGQRRRCVGGDRSGAEAGGRSHEQLHKKLNNIVRVWVRSEKKLLCAAAVVAVVRR